MTVVPEKTFSWKVIEKGVGFVCVVQALCECYCLSHTLTEPQYRKREIRLFVCFLFATGNSQNVLISNLVLVWTVFLFFVPVGLLLDSTDRLCSGELVWLRLDEKSLSSEHLFTTAGMLCFPSIPDFYHLVQEAGFTQYNSGKFEDSFFYIFFPVQFDSVLTNIQ